MCLYFKMWICTEIGTIMLYLLASANWRNNMLYLIASANWRNNMLYLIASANWRNNAIVAC